MQRVVDGRADDGVGSRLFLGERGSKFVPILRVQSISNCCH